MFQRDQESLGTGNRMWLKKKKVSETIYTQCAKILCYEILEMNYLNISYLSEEK